MTSAWKADPHRHLQLLELELLELELPELELPELELPELEFLALVPQAQGGQEPVRQGFLEQLRRALWERDPLSARCPPHPIKHRRWQLEVSAVRRLELAGSLAPAFACWWSVPEVASAAPQGWALPAFVATSAAAQVRFLVLATTGLEHPKGSFPATFQGVAVDAAMELVAMARSAVDLDKPSAEHMALDRNERWFAN